MKLFTVAFLLFLAMLTPSFASDTSSPPSFTKLKDALTFIDAALDKKDWPLLTNALYPPYEGEPNQTYFDQLKAERGNRRLVDIFSHQEFPISPLEPGGIYTIGQIDNLRDSRIRFIKDDQKWYIHAIYGVR